MSHVWKSSVQNMWKALAVLYRPQLTGPRLRELRPKAKIRGTKSDDLLIGSVESRTIVFSAPSFQQISFIWATCGARHLSGTPTMNKANVVTLTLLIEHESTDDVIPGMSLTVRGNMLPQMRSVILVDQHDATGIVSSVNRGVAIFRTGPRSSDDNALSLCQ